MTRETLKEIVREKFTKSVAFGMKIGWTPQKVTKFLNGEYIPKLNEAVTISDALGISIDELASFFME